MVPGEDFVKLQTDKSGGHGGGGGYGGDDSSGDEFRFQFIDFRDAVVSRSHVRKSRD